MSKKSQPPAVLIVLPLEGASFVARTATDDEWPRLIDWVFSRPRWVSFITAAYKLERPEEEDDEDEDDELAGASPHRSHDRPRRLASRARSGCHRRPVRPGRGAFPDNPEAEPDDAHFRPNEMWPPSLREFEERE